jgi:serine protease Do
MFRRSRSALIVTCLALGSAGGYMINSAIGPVHAEQKVSPVVAKELTSYRTIVKDVVPAVVSIDSKVKAKRGMRFRPDREGNIELGLGSGVIIDAEGTILTNYHVVDGAEFVEVHLADGRTFTSHDMAGDKKTDLAIVKIKADKPLPFLTLGDSSQMEVGDRVLAVGAPFGLASSVTHGIISAKARNMGLNAYEDFLQTDAAINPGNSGGPLISLDGKVIGINSAIKSRSGGFQGVGMAISSNLAKSVMTQLMKDGTVHRGYLGVAVSDVNSEVAQELHVKEHAGVVITRVFPKSPAAKGGLKPGDVVTTIAGKPIHEGGELQKLILSLPLNQPVEVAFLRDGETKTAKVVVEEQPEDYGVRTLRDDDDDQ